MITTMKLSYFLAYRLSNHLYFIKTYKKRGCIMDVRHETSKEAIINQLIQYMNQLILSQTDALAKNDKWRNHLMILCQSIYLFTGMPVEHEKILSNKNLLSIDVVLLPEIHNISSVIISNQERYQVMYAALIAELNTDGCNTMEIKKQKEEMRGILDSLDPSLRGA